MKLDGYLTFLDENKKHKKTCSANLVVVDGKVSGSMIDHDDPENVMKILDGKYKGYSFSLTFDSAGEELNVYLERQVTKNSFTVNLPLGIMGWYGGIVLTRASNIVFGAFNEIE